jgi:hypothetical protein
MIQRFLEWLARKWSKLEDSKPHTHDWRQITTYARQCRTRTCGLVEYLNSDVPEGMSDYLRLMTTRIAAQNPLEESMLYLQTDPRMMGGKCKKCGRPKVEGRPSCPYCLDVCGGDFNDS